MINLSGRIRSRAFGQRVKFEKAQSEYKDDGRAHETVEPFFMRAIVQPAGADDLELLEEGQRHLPSQLVHTNGALMVGDYMHYKGTKWRVVNAQDWSDYGFYKCIAIKYDGTEASDSEGFVVT